MPSSAWAAPAPVQVFYAGPEGKTKTALSLAENFQLNRDLDQANVIILNGVIPNAPAIAARVRSGVGLIIIAGPEIQPAALSTLLNSPLTPTFSDQDVSPVQAPDSWDLDPISNAVIWTSAPQVKERMLLASSPLKPLVEAFEDHSMILGVTQVGQGTVYLFTPYLNENQNIQFQQWAYFNYSIYYLVSELAGLTPLTFGQYPGSPVPHGLDQAVIFALLGSHPAGHHPDLSKGPALQPGAPRRAGCAGRRPPGIPGPPGIDRLG